jgi:CheY-like chemotaxis protein
MGDPTQIHQILINLCTNAGHAMREKGGILEVALRTVELETNSESGSEQLAPGTYLNLTVSDTGHGIPLGIQDRVFDPFFTTKKREEGTGMGLAVVHGIVKSYGGAIYVSSKPGKGASFKVLLPAIESKMETDDEIHRAVPPKGNERILFVDDEPPIVELGENLLKSLGYRVVTRTSSVEALELFRARPDRFDLLITDMTMPNMTGDKLAEAVMSINKETPVILCTGFSNKIDEPRAKAMGISEFIMKPIIRRDLAAAVRRSLDQSKDSCR